MSTASTRWRNLADKEIVVAVWMKGAFDSEKITIVAV